jgi:hypothetical protein
VEVGMSTSDDSGVPDKVQRDDWLVKASVILAVCLEVFPTEADLICSTYATNIVGGLVVKTTCLTLILSPLLAFTIRNGLGALRHVWGRVAVIIIIVSVNLAVNYSYLMWNLTRQK